MSDNSRNDERDTPPEEAALSARLKRLGERLERVAPAGSGEAGPASGPSANASALARGFRLSTELVAGVLVGAGLGWLIDRWLGSSPFGLLGFLLLGFAAGVLNVMRSAGVMSGGVPDSTVERRND